MFAAFSDETPSDAEAALPNKTKWAA